MATRKIKQEVPDGIDISTWPTRALAAQKIGVSLSTLKRYEDTGEVNAYVDDRGIHHFDPAELELFSKNNNGGSNGPASDIIAAAAATIQAANEHARQNQEYVAELVKLVTGPVKSFLELSLKSSEDLALENKRLRNKNFDMLESFEKVMSEQNARDIERRQYEENEKRKTQAWGMFMEQAPTLLQQVVGGKSAAHMAKLGPILAKLTDDQLSSLVMVNIITESEKDVLLKAREAFTPKEKPAPADSEEPASPEPDGASA